MTTRPHQYIERDSGAVRTEILFADQLINLIWSDAREDATALFRALTSKYMSRLLAFLSYDIPLSARISGASRFGRRLGMDLSECLDPPESLDTARKLFERKIRYWETRPMDPSPETVVSPADSKMLIGSFGDTAALRVKNRFFDFNALIGNRPGWIETFRDGDFAIFRLTPDKYHYNHLPVSGVVRDIFELPGAYCPCNPGAVMTLATPYSRNKRVVTVLDTDVPDGTGVGMVAMIEVVALMIGDIVQCYSETRYDRPQPAAPGMFLRKGQPKSLYRPGSSTDVLIFEKGKMAFSPDLVANQNRFGVETRYAQGLGRPLVETEVRLRATIGKASAPSPHR